MSEDKHTQTAREIVEKWERKYGHAFVDADMFIEAIAQTLKEEHDMALEEAAILMEKLAVEMPGLDTLAITADIRALKATKEEV